MIDPWGEKRSVYRLVSPIGWPHRKLGTDATATRGGLVGNPSRIGEKRHTGERGWKKSGRGYDNILIKILGGEGGFRLGRGSVVSPYPTTGYVNGQAIQPDPPPDSRTPARWPSGMHCKPPILPLPVCLGIGPSPCRAGRSAPHLVAGIGPSPCRAGRSAPHLGGTLHRAGWHYWTYGQFQAGSLMRGGNKFPFMPLCDIYR